MNIWQVLTFEVNANPETPHIHAPIIQAALDALGPNGSADFCVLDHWWHKDGKMFRDYYFSPEAIVRCGAILIQHPGTMCEMPSGSGYNLVAGNCHSFIAQTRAAS